MNKIDAFVKKAIKTDNIIKARNRSGCINVKWVLNE